MFLLQRGDLSRLRDSEGKPPGLIGWWPSHATTFLENHDTVRPAGLRRHKQCCGSPRVPCLQIAVHSRTSADVW